MRATAKLVNAIKSGSIAAFIATDATRPINNFLQCPQINPMGGLDSDFTLDPITLTLQCSTTGAVRAPNGVTGLNVMLPGWVGANFPYITLDMNLNAIKAPDGAALTSMANAGYFA
jgi:hypothetical protein